MGRGLLSVVLSHTFRYLSFWIALHAPSHAQGFRAFCRALVFRVWGLRFRV